MKREFILIFLCSLLLPASSQDWNLFVKNQPGYYRQQAGITSTIEDFIWDSSYMKEPNSLVMLFNAKSELNDLCNSVLMEEIEYFDWLQNPEKIKCLIRNGDSVLYICDHYSKQDTFIFKPFSKPGDSWQTNGILVECDSAGSMNLFGTNDSIKNFKFSGSGFDTIDFVLSKSHGLVSFLPFNVFFHHSVANGFPPYFELIGYSSEDQSHGYKRPDFSDFFHLSAGDLLYWRNYSVPYEIWEEVSITYCVDSITRAFITSDSVHYNFERRHYDENGHLSGKVDYSSYYLRKLEGKILSNATSSFGLQFDPYQSSEIFYLSSLSMKIENGDTVSYAEYTLPGLFLDLMYCEIGFIYDYDLTVRYNTREGHVFTASYSWGESSRSLIGSVIDGETFGVTNIPVNIDDRESRDLLVYPNPASETLHIRPGESPVLKVKLYDMAGNLILSEPYREMLDISYLKGGIYILELVYTSKGSSQFKIIKE